MQLTCIYISYICCLKRLCVLCVCVCVFLPNIMAYYSDLCIHDWYVTDKLFFAALNSPQGDAPEIPVASPAPEGIPLHRFLDWMKD